MHLRIKSIIFVVFILLFLSTLCSATVLNVPELSQEQSQWCWSGTRQATLSFFGATISQCDMANFARINNGWGNDDCCANPTGSICNQPNWMYGTAGSFQAIMSNWGVDSTARGYALSQNTVLSEITAGRPFQIRWGWIGGGGHFVTGRGIDGNTVHYMDPWPGNGYQSGTYSWIVNGGMHVWTHSLQMTCVDVDNDGFFTDSGCGSTADCDDSDSSINTGAAEVCDATDNNCDGEKDEGCVCGVSVEVCDEIDNDCDASIDEGFDVGVACTVGVGACENSGNKVCTGDGLGTECDVVAGTPGSESCDGFDNDCDGNVDENGNILCGDGLYCNGTETCDGSNGCLAGTAVDCDDSVSCTADSCDEAGDQCVNANNDSDCDDGNLCTDDICNGASGCQNDVIADCNNLNAPIGVSADIEPSPPVPGIYSIWFEEIINTGTATVQDNCASPANLPGAYTICGNYFDITLTGVAFNGNIEVCAPYDPLLVNPGDNVYLMHYINGDWERLDSTVGVSPDQVCGLATSLSPFAPASSPPASEAADSGGGGGGGGCSVSSTAHNMTGGSSVANILIFLLPLIVNGLRRKKCAHKQ